MIEKNIKSEIHRAFVDTLSRNPKAQTIEELASKISDYSSACAFFKSSKEYKEKIQPIIDFLSKDNNKKILIFGAYGNGNLGDSIQALHVSRAINDSFPNVSVYATSKQKYFYEFDASKKLPSWVLKNKLIMKEFKALFIGGGGILSHPHPPLNDLSWVNSLEVPVVILGVGASKDNLQKGSWLLNKSWRVSGRDKQSIDSIGHFLPQSKVSLIRDPVLCSHHYKKNRVEKLTSDNNDVWMWVLKNTDGEECRKIKLLMKEDDIIVAMEEGNDSVLNNYFSNVIYVKTLTEFEKLVSQVGCVVSMRYHGVILGLVSSVSVIGIGTLKSKFLLTDLGSGERHFESLTSFYQAVESSAISRGEIIKGSEVNRDVIDKWCLDMREFITSSLSPLLEC